MTIKTIFFDLDNTLLASKEADNQVLDKVVVFLIKRYPQIKAEQFKQGLIKQANSCFEQCQFYDFTVRLGISPFEGLWGDFSDESLRFPELANRIKQYRQAVWEFALREVGVLDSRLAKLLSLMFVEIRTETSLIYEDTYLVLDQLYERYQLILLTNGCPKMQKLKLVKEPKLKKYFKKVIISGDFGQGKPSPNFIDFAVSRAQTMKQVSVMIGNSLYTDILGANTAGIRSIWLNRHEAEPNDAIVPTFTVSTLADILTIIEKEGLK